MIKGETPERHGLVCKNGGGECAKDVDVGAIERRLVGFHRMEMLPNLQSRVPIGNPLAGDRINETVFFLCGFTYGATEANDMLAQLDKGGARSARIQQCNTRLR